MSNKKEVVVCFGPGPKFKGGISNYNTSLARSLDSKGAEVHIVSWTQQYPAIIPREFVDKSSKTDFIVGTGIRVKYITNYNNPVTWNTTAQYIISLKAKKVIFQWSIALQGLPLGRIIRKISKVPGIEIIIDLHFVVQKENSLLDRYFTKMGIARAHTFIVHALKTYDELQKLFPARKFTLSYNGTREEKTTTVLKLFHPIYDLFRPDPSFDVKSFKQKHNLRSTVFLFFGFIRKYKGLHNVIRAFDLVADKRKDVSLLICGESFWHTLDSKKFSTRIKNFIFGAAKKIFLNKSDDERNYKPLELLDVMRNREQVVVFNQFVPNEDVHKYFQVSDCVVLYYLTATPSGIESLSYNFKLPILATNVGHFPETINDGFNGYLARPDDIEDMAIQMLRFLDHPLAAENVTSATSEMSWDNYAKAIMM